LQIDIDLRLGDTKLEGRHVPGMSQRVAGDVWIDDEDRIRRVTWRRPFMRRPRSPLKLPAFTSWRTVELWEFGTPADIEIPTPLTARAKPVAPRHLRRTVVAVATQTRI
jgi:hypothetical protein